MLWHALNGEMGAAADFLIAVDRDMSNREQAVSKMRTTTAVVEEHLTKGLPKMLSANGVTSEFQEAVSVFLRPALTLLGEMEREVLSAIRGQPVVPDAPVSQAVQLEGWVETFSRLASTPQQMKAARGFAEFVEETIRPAREQGREPRPRSYERE